MVRPTDTHGAKAVARLVAGLVATVAIFGYRLAPLAAQAPPQPDTTHATGTAGSDAWTPHVLGTQIEVIAQRLARLRSPYAGPNSLDPAGDHAVSHVYGVYLGARPFAWGARDRALDRAAGPANRVEAYLDAEMVRGRGVSRTVGLAGLTNGDVIRQGSADLGDGPYIARAYVRVVHRLGSRGAAAGHTADTAARAPDQLPGPVPARRLEVTAGKLAASDLFDLNRYANTTRQQFMNWGLFQNTAWDFAADTRGYTNGVAVAWVTPDVTLRAGSFQMPRAANGNVFDANLGRARGDQAEVTVTPQALGLGARTPTVRVLGYVNHARMGVYRDALAAAATATATTPDIVADDRPGRRKVGYGLNAEWPVADGGETGAFARYGWNDGRTESFAFTEVEHHLSGGVQVSGAHWRRAADRVGLAAVRHGLSADHAAYLAAGGAGFLLGDGRLAYGPETIVEAYYRAEASVRGVTVQVSPDVQRVANPGYNRDRGPATVVGVRLNLRY